MIFSNLLFENFFLVETYYKIYNIKLLAIVKIFQT